MYTCIIDYVSSVLTWHISQDFTYIDKFDITSTKANVEATCMY